MSAEDHFKQCTFKNQATGLIETAWLPERLAEAGGLIYFGAKQQVERDCWEILSVGDRACRSRT